jgi:hypothetical protein
VLSRTIIGNEMKNLVRVATGRHRIGGAVMRRAFLAMFACITVALLLGGCGSSAPAHQDPWLSFKYSNGPGCAAIPACLAALNTDGNTEVNSYYEAIGAQLPTGAPLTFANWQQEFGYPGTLGTIPGAAVAQAHAFYGNQSDLQLGRDMHCWQSSQTGLSGTTIACYVTNYGPPPIDPSTQKENLNWPNLESAVDDAINQNNPFATVAMVFNANGIGLNKDTVAFYVFNQFGNLTQPQTITVQPGNLALDAELDGEGPKTVPRMCMACHGGTYDATHHSVKAAPGGNTASFLPFDVWSFFYSENPNNTAFSLQNQQEAFRELNYLVLQTNPSPAIKCLINDLYSNTSSNPLLPPNNCATTPNINVFGNGINDDSYVPGAWSTSSGSVSGPIIYKGVFRKYCRMCHLAQDPPADFSTLAEFQGLAGGANSLVCTMHDMPHAEVPFGGQTTGGSPKFSANGIGFWFDHASISDLNTVLQQNGGSACPSN